MKRFINTKVVIDLKTDQVIEREGFDYDGPMALAVAATAVSKVCELPMKGGVLQCWTCTLDPGSIAAGAQEIDTVAITGARSGDPCWANLQVPVANLLLQGAAVTANDVVSIYLANNITVTTALDSTSLTIRIFIIKMTVGS